MRFATKLVLVMAVSVSSMALAQDDEGAPPESGGNAFKRSGALLDRTTYGSRPMMLSIHGLLPYGHFGFGGFPIGAGAALYIPLVANGFIPPLNDEFGLDLGIDAVGYFGYVNPFALYIPVGVMWKFHLLQQLEVYVKAGFMPRLWFGHASFFWPDFYTAVGANWMLSKSFGLKLEVGYPGVRFGIVLAF